MNLFKKIFERLKNIFFKNNKSQKLSKLCNKKVVIAPNIYDKLVELLDAEEKQDVTGQRQRRRREY